MREQKFWGKAKTKRTSFLDGVPGRPREKKFSFLSSSDFASQPFESTVFLRSHRTLRRVVSGNVSTNVDDARAVPRRFLQDVRRTNTPSICSVQARAGNISKWYRTIFHRTKKRTERSDIFHVFSPRSVLRASFVAAILLGAVSMAMVYRYLGEQVLAREESVQKSVETESLSSETIPSTSVVLGASDQYDDRFVEEVTKDLEDLQMTEEKNALEEKIRTMVAGYPIETMVPFILEKDKIVAAFLVGIAKKESAWGKRVPLLNSHDCFNYWGYRGKRRLMGTGGHTCFNSPKDAVDTVSRRLEKLIYTEKVDTPAEMMVVWKCGYDCSAHAKADTKKWVQDVNLYFHQLDEE